MDDMVKERFKSRFKRKLKIALVILILLFVYAVVDALFFTEDHGEDPPTTVETDDKTDEKIEILKNELFSFDSEKITKASYDLGEMGKDAISAIALLINVTLFEGDENPSVEIKINEGGKEKIITTTPVEEAKKALNKIDPDWKNGREANDFITALRLSLVKSNDDGRMMASKTLAKFDDIRAVKELIVSLRYDLPAIKEQSEITLKTITGQDFGSDADKWEKWWEENKDK